MPSYVRSQRTDDSQRSSVRSPLSAMPKGVKLQVPDWKEDVVYLFQFPRTRKLPNVSSFCLKIESFLRLHQIKHEIRYTMRVRTEQGLLPLIELNGRPVADSGLIMDHIKKHFAIQDYADEREAALGRAVARTCDEHTFHVIYKYKILDHSKLFAAQILSPTKIARPLRPIAESIFGRILHKKAVRRIGSSIGLFSDVVAEKMLRDDFQMYEELLKQGKNLFGDKITEADLTVWSHMATTLFMPFEMLPKTLIKEEYPLLRAFTERIREEIWGDEFAKDIKQDAPLFR